MTTTHSHSQTRPADTAGHQAPITPGEIAVGVAIGRASEYFDFFVYAIASVLVFPALFLVHRALPGNAAFIFKKK